MAVTIRDAADAPTDRAWIQSVYQNYLEDLSKVSMNTGLFPVRGDFGDREPDLFARWFTNDGSHPLLILQNGRSVGFALVSRPLVHQRQSVDFRMAEFFIVAAARRCGIGLNAAALIFNRFAGQWEVSEFLSNSGAVAFWRRVINDYTRGSYRESVANGEVQQHFSSAVAERRR